MSADTYSLKKNIHIILSVFNFVVVFVFVIVPSFRDVDQSEGGKILNRRDSSGILRRDLNDTSAPDIQSLVEEAVRRHFAVSCSNDSVICLKGPKGDRGPKGDQGPPGTSASQDTSCCNLIGSPKIIDKDDDTILVTEGSVLNITCDVEGFPPAEIIWISGQTLIGETLTSGHALSISNVTKEGEYTCLAKNAFGNDSKTFVIDIALLTFQIKPQPEYAQRRGQPLSINCTTAGIPNVTVEWYKDNTTELIDVTDIGGVHTVTINNGTQLVIHSLTSELLGDYVCKAWTEAEEIEATTSVYFVGPPVIEPATVTAMEGENVTLKCDVTARPPANITWNFPHTDANVIRQSDGTLLIPAVPPMNDFYFICIAQNQYGKDEQTLTLNVQVPAQATISTSHIAITKGHTAIALTCDAKGDDPLTVQWFKDGTLLNDSFVTERHFLLPGNTLLVSESMREDTGEYTCKASNHLANASVSAYAYIDGKTANCNTTFDDANCTDSVCGATCTTGCSSNHTEPIADVLLTYETTSRICGAGLEGGVINDEGVVIWKTDEHGHIMLIDIGS